MDSRFVVQLNLINFKDIQDIVYRDQYFIKDQQFTKEKKDTIIHLIQTQGKNVHKKIISNIIDVISVIIALDTNKTLNFDKGRDFYTHDDDVFSTFFERIYWWGILFQTQKSEQKLKCIFSYFKHYLENKDQIKNQEVKFTKKTETNNIDLQQYQNQYSNVKLFEKIAFTNGRNEDEKNAIIVDFADENIGGLVLDPSNLAQEEVLMLIYPEAIVSMLFITPMAENQAILIENLIQYNDYQGYESTFRWIYKNFVQTDVNHMLAIDARPFHSKSEQLGLANVVREFKKCLIGFSLALKNNQNYIISTGKWGCGIFNGDSYLKTLIQLAAFLIAAQENHSPESKLKINTVGDSELKNFGDNIKGKYTNLHLNDLIHLLQNLPECFSNNFMNLMESQLQQKSEIAASQVVIEQQTPFQKLFNKFSFQRLFSRNKRVLPIIILLGGGCFFMQYYYQMNVDFQERIKYILQNYTNPYLLGVAPFLVVFGLVSIKKFLKL